MCIFLQRNYRIALRSKGTCALGWYSNLNMVMEQYLASLYLSPSRIQISPNDISLEILLVKTKNIYILNISMLKQKYTY